MNFMVDAVAVAVLLTAGFPIDLVWMPKNKLWELAVLQLWPQHIDYRRGNLHLVKSKSVGVRKHSRCNDIT